MADLESKGLITGIYLMGGDHHCTCSHWILAKKSDVYGVIVTTNLTDKSRRKKRIKTQY